MESRGLLLKQNDWRQEKLQDPWCWTSCYCWELLSLAYYLEQLYQTVEVPTNHSNLNVFISTYKLMQRQVQLALDLSAFDFWLVYCNGTLNPIDGHSCRPDYQRDVKLEDSITGNTSALQKILFPIVAEVTSQPMSHVKEKARQILVDGIPIHDLRIKWDKHMEPS